MELPPYPNNPAKQDYSQTYCFEPSQPIPQAVPKTQSIESQPVILQNQDLDQAKYQVQRWSNWVRFLSIFLILDGLTGLIPSIYYLFVFEAGMNPDLEKMQLLNIFFELSFLLVGAVGYIVAVKKTAGPALCYMIMLLGEIAVLAYLGYIFIQMITDDICPILAQVMNNGLNNCNQEVIEGTIIISAILFAFFILVLCVPVMICPWKLYRHAKYVEKRKKLKPVYQDKLANS